MYVCRPIYQCKIIRNEVLDLACIHTHKVQNNGMRKNVYTYPCTEFTCNRIKSVLNQFYIEWKLHVSSFVLEFRLLKRTITNLIHIRPLCIQPISTDSHSVRYSLVQLHSRTKSLNDGISLCTSQLPWIVQWSYSFVWKRKKEPFIHAKKPFRFTVSTFILIDWRKALWLCALHSTWALSHRRSKTHQSVNISTLIGIMHRVYQSERTIERAHTTLSIFTYLNSIYVFITLTRCT